MYVHDDNPVHTCSHTHIFRHTKQRELSECVRPGGKGDEEEEEEVLVVMFSSV